MTKNIKKTFKNGESVNYELRAKNRAMFSINLSNKLSAGQKLEISNTVHNFLKNGKMKEIKEVMNSASSMRHLVGLIETMFMTKHIKVKKVRERKINIKVGKKVTDIAIDKFYLI